MRYLLFVRTDPSAELCDPARDHIEEWVSHYDDEGIRTLGDRRAGVDRAVTVHVRNGQRLTTDGPFVETKEWIAGFDLNARGRAWDGREHATLRKSRSATRWRGSR
jgi:hypothetical protein